MRTPGTLHSVNARPFFVAVATVVFSALAVACSGDRFTQPTDKEMSLALRDPAHMVAQDLAQLLNAREDRVRLRELIDGSPYIEDRLRLSEVIQRTDLNLPDSLRAHARAALAQGQEIDVYFPVRQHRETWSGAEPPQVAALLPLSGQVVAYTGDGKARRLSSAETPAEPTLVVMATELHYEDLGSALKPSAPDITGTRSPASTAGTTVYISSIQFEEAPEPWFRGAPEFEIHGFTIGLGGETGFCAFLTQGNTGKTFTNNQQINLPINAVTQIGTGVGSGAIDIVAYEDDNSGNGPCSGIAFSDGGSSSCTNWTVPRQRDYTGSGDGDLDDWMGDGQISISGPPTGYPGSRFQFQCVPGEGFPVLLPISMIVSAWRP